MRIGVWCPGVADPRDAITSLDDSSDEELAAELELLQTTPRSGASSRAGTATSDAAAGPFHFAPHVPTPVHRRTAFLQRPDNPLGRQLSLIAGPTVPEPSRHKRGRDVYDSILDRRVPQACHSSKGRRTTQADYVGSRAPSTRAVSTITAVGAGCESGVTAQSGAGAGAGSGSGLRPLAVTGGYVATASLSPGTLSYTSSRASSSPRTPPVTPGERSPPAPAQFAEHPFGAPDASSAAPGPRGPFHLVGVASGSSLLASGRLTLALDGIGGGTGAAPSPIQMPRGTRALARPYTVAPASPPGAPREAPAPLLPAAVPITPGTAAPQRRVTRRSYPDCGFGYRSSQPVTIPGTQASRSTPSGASGTCAWGTSGHVSSLRRGGAAQMRGSSGSMSARVPPKPSGDTVWATPDSGRFRASSNGSVESLYGISPLRQHLMNVDLSN